MRILQSKKWLWPVAFCVFVIVISVFFVVLLTKNNIRGATNGETSPRTSSRDGSTLEIVESDWQSILEEDVLSGFESSFARSAHIYSILSDLRLDELLALFQQSRRIKRDSLRQDVQVAVVRKLSVLSPKVALECAQSASSLQRRRLIRGVFREWSQIDLNAATGAAKNLEDTDKRNAVRAILLFRDDLSANQRQEIAIQLGSEDQLLRIQSEKSALQMIDNPAKAWAHVISDDLKDSLQLDLLVEIGKEWHGQVGFEVLSNVLHSFSDPYDRQILYEIVAPIVAENPSGALDSIKQLSQAEREPLATAIFLSWMDSNPLTALQAVPNFETNTAVLDSIQKAILFKWAREDADGILNNVELVPDRLKLYAIETAIERTTLESPEKAIRQMHEMSEFLGNNSKLTTRIVTVWSRSDPSAASDWVLSNVKEGKAERRRLLSVSLRQLVLFDPQYALELALSEPLDENGRGLELTLVKELSSNGNTRSAIEILPDIRGASPRVSALVAVGTGFVLEDSPLEAIDLASQVPESYRWYFYGEVFRAWANGDPEQLLESLERLPSEHVRSWAGMQLVITNRSNSALTNEQIDYAKSFLTETDAMKAARLEEN